MTSGPRTYYWKVCESSKPRPLAHQRGQFNGLYSLPLLATASCCTRSCRECSFHCSTTDVTGDGMSWKIRVQPGASLMPQTVKINTWLSFFFSFFPFPLPVHPQHFTFLTMASNNYFLADNDFLFSPTVSSLCSLKLLA